MGRCACVCGSGGNVYVCVSGGRCACVWEWW